MQKSILIAVLFISTTLSAHYNHNHQGFFDDDFFSGFGQKFQEFDRKISNLQNKYSQQTVSRQYFDQAENAYILEIKIQGVDKNNINIEATKDNLSIKGWETKNAGNSHSSASFSFTTSIPVDADSNNISADFNEDILKISIPKLKSSNSKTQKIIIK